MTATTATTWEAVIGLEVHVEMATATKLFCSCKNEFGAEPNTNICHVCLGLPGSLPVLGERAVEFALRVGEALQCTVPERSLFHRKNYFYPDMPKDYQISQYDEPICIDGVLDVDGFRVGIERAHMEEDTGKTIHVGGGGRIHEADHSLVDYNRAGIPLMEVVSRPDLRNAEQARAYVNELRGILQAIGVSDVKMEEGAFRIDANVSLRPEGAEALGSSMRERVRAGMPELPAAWRARLVSEWGIGEHEARVLIGTPGLAEFAEAAVVALRVGTPKDVVNWCTGEVIGYLHETGLAPGALPLAPDALAELVDLVADGTLSRNLAKDVLAECLREPKRPKQVVEERGLAQVSDEGELASIVDEILAAHPDVVADYRAGDDKARKKKRGFLMGEAMRATRGQGNPQLLNRLLDERLS